MFIDDLIAYCEARSPGFRDEIQGLPDIVFESYEEFVGKTLPRMYRDFQLTLGWNTGPWVFKDLTFRENELLTHNCLTGADYPGRYVMLALHTPPPEHASALSWFYDLDRCGPDDGPVVAFDDRMGFSPERVMPIADSLQELLCNEAFAALSVAPRAEQLHLRFYEDPGQARPRFRRAAALLETRGFVAPLPVSRNYWGGEHADGKVAMVHCLPHHDTSFAIDIAGASRHGLRSLQAVLEQELGTAA